LVVGNFTITLNTPAPSGGTTVNYLLTGTATLSTDYNVTAGTHITAVNTGSFTIAAGQTTATLNVTAVTDNLVDPNETVNLSLAAGTDYQLAVASSATLTITDLPPNTAPTLVTPTTVTYTDTQFVDDFINQTGTHQTGTLSGSDVDVGTTLTYGITGGTPDLIAGTVSKTNAFGTLTVTTTTGAYSFIPYAPAIEPLGANATDTDSTINVTVSDGALSVSKAFTVTITQQGTTETNLDNTFTGKSANSIDSWAGLSGNDTYNVDNVGDIIDEQAVGGTDTVLSSVNYTLSANVERLYLLGLALIGTGNTVANLIVGNSGNNSLDGVEGPNTADTLIGGAGDDTYSVHNANDTVTENAGQGTDIVSAYVDYTLADNVEQLNLTGSAVIYGTGNSGANLIVGNAADNILNGGGGADWLVGGAGNDTYIINNPNVTVLENNAGGTDTVQSIVTYVLTDNVEILTLMGSSAIDGYGNALDNSLTGNSADNVLVGNAGADTMTGRAGNDTYFVDNIGDSVTEQLNEGTDTVSSSINYTLTANVERLFLTGTALNGTGNAQANLLIGNNGNNTLDDGGADVGADTLIGGAGDDTYIIHNTADTVIESAGQGSDTAYAFFDYTLAANIEQLYLEEGSAAIRGTGNTNANLIVGNSGNNSLNGGEGADWLVGNDGNDTYTVDNLGVTVLENSVSGGTDNVQSSVTFVLTANVENLRLTGSAAAGYGNALDNTITGNSANNLLVGNAGADTLIGGLGQDAYNLNEASPATDTIRIASGDSIASMTGYDYVVGFKPGTGTNTIGVDQLDLVSTLIATNTAGSNGIDSALGTIKSHSITAGIIKFDNADNYDIATPLAISMANPSLANEVISYLQANITAGNSVAFTTTEGNTFVFQDDGTTDTLVALVGVTATSLDNTGLAANSVWIV
jgi:Ca2+-binding RTX toxin-like protein